MPNTDHLKFNFVQPHIGWANDQVQLENNLVSWLNHAFLNVGAFINVPTGGSLPYGGTHGKLRPVDQPGYADYQVYQGARKDWVFETTGSIEYSAGSPTQCTGVYVNGTFYATDTTTGTYAHRIEFPAGRVVFTNGAISSTADVRAAYAYRLVQVTKGDPDDFKRFEYFSNRADEANFLMFGSGTKDPSWQNRIQMPCIAVILGKSKSEPYQMGTLQQWIFQSVTFQVYAENKFWRDQLMDILKNQNDKRIYMVDFNTVAASGQYPLTIYGAKNPSGLMYPDLVKFPDGGGHAYGLLGFTDTRISARQKIHDNLFYGAVTAEMEFLMRGNE